MKKKFFYSVALASALMLGACSSNDDLNGSGTGNSSDVSYLAINIKNVGGATSRAAGRSSSDYEDGEDYETHINGVRFYFFNADGTPYMLRKDGVSTGKNWLDKEDPDEFNSTEKDNPNISMISKTVLVIEGNKGTSPASVIAVINPNTLDGDGLDDHIYTIDQLKQTPTFKTFYLNNNGKFSNFVMSNSVYVDKGISKCSSIVTGHVAESKDAAMNNPVDLYVERAVAKVETSINDNNANKNWTEIEGKKALKVGTYSTNDIYAVVDGWGVADEDGTAELFKQVSTSWTNDQLGIEGWNVPEYHRCFWSSSVPFTSGDQATANAPVNHSYNDFVKRAVGTPCYTLPNTSATVYKDPYDSYLTKMLVAAHLVYLDEKTKTYKKAEISQYRGQQYISVDDVKKTIAGENEKYWIASTTADGKTIHTKLAPSDIEFDSSNSDNDDMKDYEVKPVLRSLKDGEKLQTLSITNGNDSTWNDVNVATVNSEIGYTKAQIRKDGMAYYYIPIRHLGTDDTKVGYYGVVRNHVYKIDINSMKGFGTPVYNPDKVIDPTLPTDKDTYLAARINVLSWRIVHQTADLDKTGEK